MSKRLTQEMFLNAVIERNNLHPENVVFLDPLEQIYINQKSILQFRCDIGHKWSGTYNNTIYKGRGCPLCKHIKQSLRFRAPFDEVENQLRKIHKTSIEYYSNTYIGKAKPMQANCNKHGIFMFIPLESIKFNRGCPSCDSEDVISFHENAFLNKAKKVHSNKYEYNFINYINAYTPIEIICKIHGSFKQRPDMHLQGHGCRRCVLNAVSKKQISWLEHISKQNNIFIQHACNRGEYRIPSTRFYVDGFCKETNTVYEFYGDAFHGNIARYSPDTKCHPFDKNVTAEYLYNKTVNRENIIRNLGYNIVTIWEMEFNQKNWLMLKNDAGY